MSIKSIFTPIALCAVLGLVVPSALADQQRGGEGDRRRSPSAQRAAPRDGGARQAPQARGENPRGRSTYAQPRESQGRSDASRQAWGGGNRGRDVQATPSRGYDASRRNDAYRNDGNRNDRYRNDGNRYDRYRNDAYRNDYRRDNRRTVVVVPRNYSRGYGYASPRGYGYYPPSFRSWIRSDYYYSRPYYAFRPRLSIGFGIWAGYPVGLPSWGYAPFPVYGYPSGGYVNVTPSRAAYGAVSFEISPSYADLYVDGNLIGRVGDFTPNHPPLTLAPGSHQVEVVAEGYEPLAFEVSVAPGQVIPYRGEMRPY